MKAMLIGLLALLAVDSCSGASDTSGEDEAPAPAGAISPAATGEMCGGIAGIRCGDEADFCRMEEGQCHMPDMAGTCSKKPQKCTRDYRPVCGCDGQTYSNACTASSNGVNVLHQGKCDEEGAE